jgi:hypothetical protein
MNDHVKFNPSTPASDAVLLHDFIDGVESGEIKAPLIIAPLLRGAVERLLRGEYRKASQ